MNRIIWAGPARIDLAALFDPFLTERPEFIHNAMAEIARLEQLLSDNPGLGAPLENSAARKLRVARTPIILIYRIERGGVTILRAHHAASDWRK